MADTMTTPAESILRTELLSSGIGANQGIIEDHHIGWLRATAKDSPLSEIRKRLQEDGYVFVKGLIPREDVMKTREHYFQHYEETDLLQPQTSLADGIFNSSKDPLYHGGIGAGDLPASELEVQKLITSHQLQEYLRLLKHNDLRRMVRGIMGWEEEILLQRSMLRHNVPGGLSTGIHYDKLFLRDGEAYFLTAWVPIGAAPPCDISFNGGGLIYLSNSAALGRSIEDDFTRRAATLPESERISAFNVNMAKFGQLSNDAEDFLQKYAKGQGKWLVANFEAGDVVFHDPYTIHCSARNNDENGRIRLSTDLRFYKKGSDIDKRWMKYWTPGDGL